jgi:MFS family permease
MNAMASKTSLASAVSLPTQAPKDKIINKPLPTLPKIEFPELPPRPLAKRSKTTTFMIVFAFCLMAIAASLEAVIVSTALPSIKQELTSGSGNDYAWVGSAYLLVSTSTLPVWARVSDIAGRGPAIVAADLFFITGSVIAAAANSMTILLLGRAVQGLGGGGLLVLINICTTDMFSLRYVDFNSLMS